MDVREDFGQTASNVGAAKAQASGNTIHPEDANSNF
jgi:hypothetical protein